MECFYPSQEGANPLQGWNLGHPNDDAGWVADGRLIKVADMNADPPSCIGDRAEIAHVAVSTNPDRWPGRNFGTSHPGQPFVELGRVSPDVGVGGSGHFSGSCRFEQRRSIVKLGRCTLTRHRGFPQWTGRTLEMVVTAEPTSG
jgi:hypothetical protein